MSPIAHVFYVIVIGCDFDMDIIEYRMGKIESHHCHKGGTDRNDPKAIPLSLNNKINVRFLFCFVALKHLKRYHI